MFLMVLRDSRRARAMRRRSPLTRVTLALSIAMSVPGDPIQGALG
jgi:hypothetical protein